MASSKLNRRAKIKAKIRSRITGTAELPRLSVYRSNKQIYAQLIDDATGSTLAAASSRITTVATVAGNKIDKAALVGKELAQKAVEAGITQVVFDRNGYLYHGRIRSLAEGAREGGLKF
jgi:large subunit ribosomal protein L18